MKQLNQHETETLAAIRGISQTIGLLSGQFPKGHCPLLKTQLDELGKLSASITIMASKIVVVEK